MTRSQKHDHQTVLTAQTIATVLVCSQLQNRDVKSLRIVTDVCEAFISEPNVTFAAATATIASARRMPNVTVERKEMAK